MDERKTIDISQFSFEEFIAFLFNRDVPDETDQWNPWFFHPRMGEVIFDPQRICDYYIRLFKKPVFLLDLFSKDQLEQGFWAIPSPTLDCSVYELINRTDLPFDARKECVNSMFCLYRDFFAIEPLDSSSGMWWDTLCYDWHCGNKKRSRGGEDLAMQNVMLETLVEILSLDSENCRAAALHGLGHLHHPATTKVIHEYLSQNPSLSKDQRVYALAASRFEVQ